jgi:hypothetical protein
MAIRGIGVQFPAEDKVFFLYTAVKTGSGAQCVTPYIFMASSLLRTQQLHDLPTKDKRYSQQTLRWQN